jgi:tRNA (cmo5U34)-methyltransferase
MVAGADSRPDEAVPMEGWRNPGQVADYLARMDHLPARAAGESALVEILPESPQSLLDLGSGDGRLAELVAEARPSIGAMVLVDSSAPMLNRARDRFRGDGRVEIREWDLNEDVTPLGEFDLVVSGFALHHLENDRERELFAEIVALLRPGGMFANLEVVASATPELHADFLKAIGREADDPEDRLVEVEPQLAWMRSAGLTQVDCMWRWRGFALMSGRSPT